MKRTLIILALSLGSLALHAQLRMPSLFSDHMVLQQQSDVAIWGWANPGEQLAIKASWSKDTVKTKVTNGATWRATLKTPVAGGPHTIVIKGHQVLTLNDVMVGEVWICSGQSNMEWSVNNGSLDAAEEMPKSKNDNIRLFHVAKSTADMPQARGDGQWQLCAPETMRTFSSVGYFFGSKLNKTLNVPIGLINVSWGGTPAEVWTPKEKVEADPELAASAQKQKEYDWWPAKPGVVYNSMIRPLVPYAIAGAIWYQGEGNTTAPLTYEKLMKTLITSWRSDFGKEFPFYFVQIAPFKYGRPFEGMLIREQQSKLLEVPGTGMVVISDKVDNVEDIHPKFKKPVGERLANLALGDLYKNPILGYKSPVYKSMVVEKNKIRVSFNYSEIGLVSYGGDPRGFSIAGADRKFYPAVAKVDGTTVVVSAKEVKEPAAVRFCFDNTSFPSLFNKEGLPVSSFRTDDWEIELK